MSDLRQRLLSRLQTRQARIGIIGLGYVGLPLAAAFAREGFCVTGVEADLDRVAALARGESYIPDVPAAALQGLPLQATCDEGALDGLDVLIICVPTPLSKTRDPDLSYVVSAAQAAARHLRRGMLIVLESTTYPGTTEELLLPLLRGQGEGRMAIGEDFFLAFSPERIDPGNAVYTLRNTPKVVGGVTPACREAAECLYGAIVDRVVPVSSPSTAEMVKLLENTFRAVNIALVNEIALMCDKLGLDVWEVIEAAASKPYGFMRFTPGPGLGGHCIPVDPHYLAWKLKTLNYNARFIELASEINTAMPFHVAQKVADALNQEGKAVKGSRILLLGVAYKRDVGDVRESPALDIMRLLQHKGADVGYHDPFVPVLELDGARLRSVEVSAAILRWADCVLVATDHSTCPWDEVARHARLVVDTRNVMAGRPGEATVIRI